MGPSGWAQSDPTVIDAAGTFAGSYTDAAGDHAFIDNAGVISSFDAPAGDFAPTVDANRDVAGVFEQKNDTHFLVHLDQIGRISTVALPSDTEQVGITGVDAPGFASQGDVVGTHYDPTKGGGRVFRTDAPGVSTPVGDPPGATSTDLSGIAPDETLFVGPPAQIPRQSHPCAASAAGGRPRPRRTGPAPHAQEDRAQNPSCRNMVNRRMHRLPVEKR